MKEYYTYIYGKMPIFDEKGVLQGVVDLPAIMVDVSNQVLELINSERREDKVSVVKDKTRAEYEE